MKTKLAALFLAACMILGITAGCSSNGNGDPTSDPTGGGITIETQSPDGEGTNTPGIIQKDGMVSVLNADEPEPQYGGDLVIQNGFRDDYYLPGVSGKGTQMVICPAIEAIGRQLNDGSWIPFLAESWEGDPENLTFTIKLREGIMFHDGSELTADVLVWNFDETIASGRSVDLGSPASYEATDDYTVVIHYDAWNPLLYEFFGLFRVVSQYSYETYGEDYMKTHAVGTGAFIQDEYVSGTSVKFVKNENYWQEGLPYLDSITIIKISDNNTQISALMNGEIHGCSFSKGSLIAQLEAAEGVKNIQAKGAGTVFMMPIMVNTTEESPFEDVLVRQAFMYALDRDASGKGVTEGIASGICQFAVPGAYNYLENPTYTYDYDPEKAKELLTEAGYPNGFSYEIMNAATYEPQMVAVQSYMKAVGIELEIRLVDTATQAADWASGNFGLTCNPGSPATFDFCNFIDRQCGPNRTRFVPSQKDFPEFFDAILKQSVAPTEEEQKALAQEVGKYLNEELPMFPWYASYTAFFVVDNLYGSNYTSVQSWQWTPETAYFA